MQYLLYPFLLLIYFELVGRWLFMKIKKKPMNFSFVVGFLFIMAILYLISWPITAFNGNFYHLVILYTILFIISVIILVKDFKKLSFKVDYKLYIIFFILLIFQLLITWNRTLGEPHGFDQIYYINMVSFNIGNEAMNTLHPHFGTYPNTDVQWITYVFQSFYYFIPYIIYIFRTVLGFVGMSFETLPAFVWGFQIIQTAIFVAVSILAIKEVGSNNKILNIAFIVLLVLFMGNLYYNNALGFIGNNYRMSIHAIATIFLFKYFKDYDKIWLFMFMMAMLGMCAVSSTGTFSFVFVLFGLFFILYDKEKDLLKYYSIVLLIPVINILVTKFGLKWWVFVGSLMLVIVVYLLNDVLIKLYQNKYLRLGTIIFCALIFIVGSTIITHNPFNIDRFFTNYSEVQDMSWDYFDFYDYKHWIFNLMVLIPLFYYLIKNRRDNFSIMSWVLIVVFFNPFGSTFMNQINWVYYRSYDIIINHFTIIYFINYLGNNIKFKDIYNVLILVLSSILAIAQIPTYWHESFIPDEDYNHLFKIENSELEVIYNVRKMVEDKNIDSPAIITSTFYMPSFIEGSTYLIGKEKRYNYNDFDENSYELYLIFFPDTDSYNGFRPDDEPLYSETNDLLAASEYDILVVDFGQYVDYNGEFVPLVDVVEEDGRFKRSEYSTARYAVYYLDEVK